MEEKQIKINGLKINYKTIGTEGVPIVLLHGWGVNSDKYSATAEYLSQMANGKWQIIIPDLPGFGKSDNPTEIWGVDDYVEFMRKFSDLVLGSSTSKLRLEVELPSKKFILIGHSFGGRITIKFAAEYPEKLQALILTGAAGIKHPPTLKTNLFFILAKIGKVIFSLPLINYFEKSAQKLLYKAAREKDYFEAQGIMKEIFKKITAEDLTPHLEMIKIPTLLVWGEQDKSTPLEDAKVVNLKIVNCKLKIVGEANHSLPYQKPQEFAKIAVAFLKKLG